MTKLKIILICTTIAVLAATPRNAAANEPSFDTRLSHKQHLSPQENTLVSSSADQLAHALLILTAVGLLTLKRR